MTTATYEYNRYMRNGQTKKMTGFVRSKSKKVQKINELRAAKVAQKIDELMRDNKSLAEA